MSDQRLLDYLKSEGYTDLRILADGSIVGVFRMLYTWGTFVDLNFGGHSGRVCWPTYEQAKFFTETMVAIDDVPPAGYTAMKRDCDRKAVNNGL